MQAGKVIRRDFFKFEVCFDMSCDDDGFVCRYSLSGAGAFYISPLIEQRIDKILFTSDHGITIDYLVFAALDNLNQ